ncbi:hypothetical protein [Enterococcus faecium]|uniref:Uncharacterized protein n=1 Tax=Enterococcus faecium TaxID=1352 RepID=A0A242B0A2_ENTFC|nr:hypothetical protein [Enterococcus faecium]OTN86667.1 hypothetical protein A5810_002992 [Enterococcus faecium]
MCSKDGQIVYVKWMNSELGRIILSNKIIILGNGFDFFGYDAIGTFGHDNILEIKIDEQEILNSDNLRHEIYEKISESNLTVWDFVFYFSKNDFA